MERFRRKLRLHKKEQEDLLMFKQLISRMKEDDNPRLHRIPFMVIWIAAFGLSWLSIPAVAMFTGDFYDTPVMNWLMNDGGWLFSLMIGAIVGFILSFIQAWALRRRYGFVPRFWRIATVIGMSIAAYGFFTILNEYDFYDNSMVVVASSIWFATVALFQSAIMFRVNRQSGLLTGIGIAAGLLSGLIVFTEIAGYNSVPWAVLVGAGIQAIGSGVVMLRLMANPREGVVPKRDTDVKAKMRSSETLHPFSFIGLWGAAYFMGWVSLGVVIALWYLTIGETQFIRDIAYWIGSRAEWVFGIMFGAIIGFASALAQPWLMKQHSKTEVRHWILLSTVGWSIAGIGLFYYMENYNADSFERFIYLSTWFMLPALFQTLPMWRAMRGGWIWIGTGIVTAIVALTIQTQFAWSDYDVVYAIMIGGIAQAIITGATFILLKSQQRQVEQQAEVVAA